MAHWCVITGPRQSPFLYQKYWKSDTVGKTNSKKSEIFIENCWKVWFYQSSIGRWQYVILHICIFSYFSPLKIFHIALIGDRYAWKFMDFKYGEIEYLISSALLHMTCISIYVLQFRLCQLLKFVSEFSSKPFSICYLVKYHLRFRTCTNIEDPSSGFQRNISDTT